MTTPPDPAKCPICVHDNECGMLKGAKECWCFFTSIRPETIERIPDEARGQTCICRTCASGWRPPGVHSKENKS